MSMIQKIVSRMAGLTDNQQAILTFISMLLLALAVLSPSQLPQPLAGYVAFLLGVCGALGMTIKEFLGIASPTTPTNSPQSANSSPSPSTSPTPTNSGPSTTNTGSGSPTAPAPYVAVTLPPLPQGFSLSAAKTEGLIVYENMQGSIIVNDPTAEAAYQWQDLYGHGLAKPDLSAYTQL